MSDEAQRLTRRFRLSHEFGAKPSEAERQEAKQVCNTTDLDALLIQRIDDLIRLERPIHDLIPKMKRNRRINLTSKNQIITD